jgi:hypothetical protein
LAVSRFLIEVSHPEDIGACARVVQVFLATGSHFLTHADWGCMDGDHRCWITVDAESKEEARCVLPPAFRADAKITGLNRFTMDEIEEILAHHKS